LVAFARHYQLQHRFAVMPDGSEVAKRYGVTGIPQVVVIDRQGKIIGRAVGSRAWASKETFALIEALLTEQESSSELGDIKHYPIGSIHLGKVIQFPSPEEQ